MPLHRAVATCVARMSASEEWRYGLTPDEAHAIAQLAERLGVASGWSPARAVDALVAALKTTDWRVL